MSSYTVAAWRIGTAWRLFATRSYLESGGVHPKVRHTRAPIYSEQRWLHELESVDENGCVDVPQGPGLGVPLDWSFINAHKTGETVYA